MGLLLGQKIMGKDVDHMSVNTEEDYQEIISDDDEQRQMYKFTSAAKKAKTE